MKLSECCNAEVIITETCSKCDDINYKVIDKKDIDNKHFGMSEAADYEPTTADEYNEKWMKEQQRRGNIAGDTK
jgi:hypothetical protein|tara:strand:+ start:429 stop:650 length:222 start_codon:yes stop_codon:yes gene_type:complete